MAEFKFNFIFQIRFSSSIFGGEKKKEDEKKKRRRRSREPLDGDGDADTEVCAREL